ncbi:MAG: C25 family cysteine peptidase, partial [Thermoplasmatota archaeon]
MDPLRHWSFRYILAFMVLFSVLSGPLKVEAGSYDASRTDRLEGYVPMFESIVIQNSLPRILAGAYGPEVTMDGLEVDPRPSYLRLPIIHKEIVLPPGSVDVEVNLRDTAFTYIPVPAGIGTNPHSIPKTKDGAPLVPEGGFEAPIQHLDHRIMTGIDQETLDTRAYLSVTISPVVPEGYMLRCMVSGVLEISYQAPACQIWYDPDVYDVLVICPEEFLGTAARYADYRNATGRYTKVVSVSDILNDRYWEVQENDTQEEIKRFIYNARLSWGIDFVLLAGDVEHIPTRHILVLDGYDDSGTMRTDGAFVPTDLYYSDLFEEGTFTFTNWNADRNGDSRYLWGEYDGMIRDDPDLYPDVFVGRIPASNDQEFSEMFEKIRGYELEAKGSDWFYNATLCGTNTFTEHPTPEGEYTCNYIASTFLDGFNVTKLFETTDTLYNISNVIDLGTGLLVFSDHGDYDGWGYTQAYPSGAYRSIYASRQENGHELPIAILDACLTHGFDNENASDIVSGKDPVYDQWYYPPGSSLDERDCLGEYLNKNPDGGAIATFGCTRVGYGSLGPSYPTMNSGYFNVRLNKAFTEGVQTPGQVLARAQKDFLMNIGVSGVTSYKTLTEYVLLGDPSLNIGGIAGTNVEIEAERDNITIVPGTEVQLNVSVRNIGIIPTYVYLNITVEGNGMSVWTANTSIMNGSIPVDGSIELSIFIYAPPNALFGQQRDVVLRVDSLL